MRKCVLALVAVAREKGEWNLLSASASASCTHSHSYPPPPSPPAIIIRYRTLNRTSPSPIYSDTGWFPSAFHFAYDYIITSFCKRHISPTCLWGIWEKNGRGAVTRARAERQRHSNTLPFAVVLNMNCGAFCSSLPQTPSTSKSN